jgi:hypothetical protein
MRQFTRTLTVLMAGVVGLVLFARAPALAAPLPCDTTTPAECQITAPHNLGAGGTFTVDRVLRIVGPNGALNTNAGSTLNLTITGGNPTGLIIENGGKITGEATTSSTVGATINITVNFGDILLAASGATISAANTSALSCGFPSIGKGGVINITAIDVEATITTELGTTISVNGNACPAGEINITAPFKGAIDIDGNVLSQSNLSGTGNKQRGGGGPISITAACALTVSDTGLISSKGKDPGADLVHLQGGCDVIINGLVESTGPGHAVPNTPANKCDGTFRPDKPSYSTGCVEVWAGRSLTINRDAGGAGHNGQINADTGNGGPDGTSWIDLFCRGPIKILNSSTVAAVHANGIGGTNDNGGVVTAKSRDDKVFVVGLGLQANATNAGGAGGTVDIEAKLDVDLSGGTVEAKGSTQGGVSKAGGHIIVQSFTANILSNAASKLDVTGGPPLGTVVLTACGATNFPSGTVTPVIPTKNSACSPPNPAGPTFNALYVILPDCPCGGQTETPPPFCDKSSVKAVMNPVTGRFKNNKGPDVVVDARTASIQTAVASATDQNLDGYIIIGVIAKDKGALGGETTQNVEINLPYTKPFALIGCSVTVHALDSSVATGHIASAAGAPAPAGGSGNIFVMDLHGNDSDVAGWQIDGDGRFLQNVNALDNHGDGFIYNGNNNLQKSGRAEGNDGAGFNVTGNGNTLTGVDAFDNGSDGVRVTGDNNLLDDVDVGDRNKPNHGDGIHVEGARNTIFETSAFANDGHGIFVKGGFNQITKSDAGDRGKPNGLDGFHVEGSSNTLDSNRANANGQDGFDIGAGGNRLKNNQSNQGSAGGSKANAVCQYNFADGSTLDLNGNKKNNAGFAGTGSPKKYTTGCN